MGQDINPSKPSTEAKRLFDTCIGICYDGYIDNCLHGYLIIDTTVGVPGFGGAVGKRLSVSLHRIAQMLPDAISETAVNLDEQAMRVLTMEPELR